MSRKTPLESLGTPLTYQQVQKDHTEAWVALPSAYQNDSCLTFFLVGTALWALADLGASKEAYRWHGIRWDRNDNLLHALKW